MWNRQLNGGKSHLKFQNKLTYADKYKNIEFQFFVSALTIFLVKRLICYSKNSFMCNETQNIARSKSYPEIFRIKIGANEIFGNGKEDLVYNLFS